MDIIHYFDVLLIPKGAINPKMQLNKIGVLSFIQYKNSITELYE